MFKGDIMRVISGKYKGKKIIGFNVDGTRPTMDRVKESLFGIIQNQVKESACLDLFAGSGSLGIEALSNGASYCYFVENNNEMTKILKENLKEITNHQVLKLDYREALKYFNKQKIKFDLVFLDPPYHLDLISDCLAKIKDYDLLNKDGLIICEYEGEVIETDYKLVKEKSYGNKNVNIYIKRNHI